MIVDLGHASPRFPGLCQELSRLGWDIDLISPRLSNRQKNLFLFKETRNWNLIETSRYRMRYKRYLNSPIHIKVLAKLSFKLVDSIRYLHQKLISESQEEYGLLDHAGWKRHVYRKVVQLTKSKKYDLVLSSSSPITAHVIARNVAEKLKLPWIADYRDLFSLNHTNPLGADSFRFESALLESANALTTVSAGFAKLQGQIYTGEIIVVNNGFKVLYPCKEAKLNGSIKILYTGTIEHGFQNLELFLEALEELNSNQVQAEVSFLGSSCSDVKHFYSIKSKAVPGFIHLNGNVSREESLSQQKSADLLLYFEWATRKSMECY